MTYKNIIFDLDGVLVFTDQYHYIAWKTIADKLKIPFDETINNQLRGVSRMESLDIILSHSDIVLTQDEKNALASEKNHEYRKLLNELSPDSISKDTLDTLQKLKSFGIKLAIGSSSKNAEFILERTGIVNLFSAVSSGNNITKTKPDPEVFLIAAKLLGAEPADCLVVEDAHAGIEAANRGAFPSVGIGDASTSLKATYRIKNITQLLEIV